MSEGRVFEVNIGFTEPSVPNPWEAPAYEQLPCPVAYLETQTKEIAGLHGLFAAQANQNGLAQLAWQNLIKRKPTTLHVFGEPNIANPNIRMMLARSFPYNSQTEIAHIGFYPNGQPHNVFFEPVASRAPQHYSSPELYENEARRYGLEAKHSDYQNHGDWIFTLVDQYLDRIRAMDLDHVDTKTFRIPYNMYELSPGEIDFLVGLQEAPDTFVRLPDHYYQ